MFTTKRLVVRDAQSLTGKKMEIYAPYSSIDELVEPAESIFLSSLTLM